MKNTLLKIYSLSSIICLFYSTFVFAQLSKAVKSSFNAANFGAKGDGQVKDTRAIQDAINACYQNGGGTVYFPPGTWLSGSLHLKSNVALFLDHGAILLGSGYNSDYDPYEKLDFENDSDDETTYFHYALIWAQDAERIAILGTGTIDANRPKRRGPKPIALKRCKYVTIKDITILNAPNYAISMLGTDYVNIDGVSILNGYCDGIDPDCCHHVRISNCYIDTWDDAIVPKASFSLGYVRSTEYLTITNCILASNCNCFKLGTESRGDFKHITVSNCVMFNRNIALPPIAGIALESVDGARIDGITINNISMKNVRIPIFLRLGNRGRDMETAVPGSFKNVNISDIVATGAIAACPIAGIPNHLIENVSLDNINITFKGGGKLEQAEIDVPEMIDKYPEADMFGELPAYGFYIRHAAGVKLRNVQIAAESPDLRHAIVCNDASELEIESLNAHSEKGAASLIKFNQVRNAFIKGCMPYKIETFLEIFGMKSTNISLLNNDFSRVKKIYSKGSEVKKSAIKNDY